MKGAGPVQNDGTTADPSAASPLLHTDIDESVVNRIPGRLPLDAALQVLLLKVNGGGMWYVVINATNQARLPMFSGIRHSLSGRMSTWDALLELTLSAGFVLSLWPASDSVTEVVISE